MSSPYWQGSRLPSLVIAIFLILMFLVAFGFGQEMISSLYDWVKRLPVWQSSIWHKRKTLIIILIVACWLVAVVAYLRYDSRKDQQAALSYAQSQGWEFSAWDDTHGIKTAVEKIFRDFKFDSPHYMRIVETGQRTVSLFNCSFIYKESARRWNTKKIACLIQSERFQSIASPLTILIQEWRNLGFELMRWPEVPIENPVFGKKFLVVSDNPAMAKKIVNESMQSMLIEYVGKTDYTPVSITIGTGGVVVMTEQNVKQERLRDLIDLAHQIERAAEK